VADRAATANLYSHYANRRPFGVLFTAFPFFLSFFSFSAWALLERGVQQTKRGCLYLSLKADKDEKQQEPLKLNYNSTTLFSSCLFSLIPTIQSLLYFFLVSIERIEPTWEERKIIREQS
jgi:hypothetical protein